MTSVTVGAALAQRRPAAPGRRCRRGARGSRSPAPSGSSAASAAASAADGTKTSATPAALQHGRGRLPHRGPAEAVRVHRQAAHGLEHAAAARIRARDDDDVAGRRCRDGRVQGAAGGCRGGSRSPARGRRPRPAASSASRSAPGLSPGRATSTRGRVTQRDDPCAPGGQRGPGGSSTGARAVDPAHGRGRTDAPAPAAGVHARSGRGDQRPAGRHGRVPTAPIGDRQPPPVPLSSARSASTATRVVGVVEAGPPPRSPRRRPPGTWRASEPWPGADGTTRSSGQDVVDPVRAAEAGQPGDREDERVAVAAVQLREPGVHVAVERVELEVRAERAAGTRRGAGCPCPRGRPAAASPASSRGPGRPARRAGPRAAGRRRSRGAGARRWGRPWRSARRGPRSRPAAPRRSGPTKAPSPQAVSTGRSSPSVRMIVISVATRVLGEAGGDPVGLDEGERAARGCRCGEVRVMGRSFAHRENRVRAARSRSPERILPERHQGCVEEAGDQAVAHLLDQLTLVVRQLASGGTGGQAPRPGAPRPGRSGPGWPARSRGHGPSRRGSARRRPGPARSGPGRRLRSSSWGLRAMSSTEV